MFLSFFYAVDPAALHGPASFPAALACYRFLPAFALSSRGCGAHYWYVAGAGTAGKFYIKRRDRDF
jgi:hypothetical protein